MQALWSPILVTGVSSCNPHKTQDVVGERHPLRAKLFRITVAPNYYFQ
jgi:hypothetical protein